MLFRSVILFRYCEVGGGGGGGGGTCPVVLVSCIGGAIGGGGGLTGTIGAVTCIPPVDCIGGDIPVGIIAARGGAIHELINRNYLLSLVLVLRVQQALGLAMSFGLLFQ